MLDEPPLRIYELEGIITRWETDDAGEMAFVDVPSLKEDNELDGFVPPNQKLLPPNGTVVDLVVIGHEANEEWSMSGLIVGVRVKENTFFYNNLPDGVLYNFVRDDSEITEYITERYRALFDDALDILYRR